MWAGEILQRIRMAFRYEAEDNTKTHRQLAYVNYHIIGSQAKEMPPYSNWLREQGLSDEIKMTPEEAELDRARVVSDVNTVVDQRLSAGGQRILTTEEVEAIERGRRSISDSGIHSRGRNQRGPSDQSIPTGGSQQRPYNPE